MALRARLEHATKIVQRRKDMINFGYDTDDVKAEMITTLTQVMYDVGITDNNRVSPAFRKTLYRLWKFYEGEAGRALSPVQRFENAALFAVLTVVADAAEQAQPQAGIEFQELLIGELAAATMTVLRPKEGWPVRPAWGEEDPAGALGCPSGRCSAGPRWRRVGPVVRPRLTLDAALRERLVFCGAMSPRCIASWSKPQRPAAHPHRV
jgi:hypothetical protein